MLEHYKLAILAHATFVLGCAQQSTIEKLWISLIRIPRCLICLVASILPPRMLCHRVVSCDNKRASPLMPFHYWVCRPEDSPKRREDATSASVVSKHPKESGKYLLGLQRSGPTTLPGGGLLDVSRALYTRQPPVRMAAHRRREIH